MLDVFESIKKEGFRRRLSHKTIVAYLYWNKRFFKFSRKDHKKITKKDVKEFIEYLSDKNLSGNTLNVALNSVKFMLEWALYKRWKINIKYSKRPKKLPVVLSKEEVKRLFSVIKNPKHRLILSLMYASGLRVSELVNLKVKDLELDQDTGWVRGGKCNKDRIFIIAEKLKDDLYGLVNRLDSNSYLFKGYNNYRLSSRTILQIVKNAAKQAKIEKDIHPHTLRHSFATHIIESGYSLQSLQGLLGHNSPDTTTIYVHTAIPKKINIKSPYDIL
ncbi:MAG: site-specific tyrosine recombinase/integron integrase [Nanoarchaeota archaeon]